MSCDPDSQAKQPAPTRGLFALLFPATPRGFPGLRMVRMTLRALHILVTGTLVGGHIFAQSKETLWPWLIAVVISGGLLLALDLYASFAVLCQVHGLLVLIKCLLLVLVVPLWDVRLVLLLLALAIGVYGSHMSGRIRHHVLWLKDRVAVDRSKG